MHLYFLRHGEADWPEWDKPDDERPLTGRGKKEMRKVARFLEKLDLTIGCILTSPLPRAKQTAEIAADVLQLKLREDSTLKPGFDKAGLNKLLQKYPEMDLMVVGHEPDFSSVIRGLSGAWIKLSKGGVALVDVDVESRDGRLVWLFPPKLAKVRK